MSVATKNSPFVEAAVAKKPVLLCIGHVDEVGECKESESGIYLVQKIHVAPVGPGRGAFINWLVRPEWLRPGFDPKSLSSVKGGDKMLFVYRNNIAGHGSISTLKGLSGSEERYAEIAARLQGLPEATPEAIQATLKAFLLEEVDENDPILIGYDLVQGKDDTGEVDAKGKKVKVLNDKYEVGAWWFATEENKKKKRAAAAASAKNLKEGESPRVLVAFEEEETPF